MAGVFDIDIFDPDIFDCGDATGPVEETDEETDEENRVTGRLSISSEVSQTAKLEGAITLSTGIILSVEVTGKLALRARVGCV